MTGSTHLRNLQRMRLSDRVMVNPQQTTAVSANTCLEQNGGFPLNKCGNGMRYLLRNVKRLTGCEQKTCQTTMMNQGRLEAWARRLIFLGGSTARVRYE